MISKKEKKREVERFISLEKETLYKIIENVRIYELYNSIGKREEI